MRNGNRKFGEKIVETIRKQRTLFVCICAMVVFVTTYLLILPAITLDKDTAKDQGGIDLPKAEQVQNEDQTSKEADKAATEAQPAGELSYEGDGYTVEAAFDAKAGLPEDTSLEASEIGSDDKDYDAWRDEALKAVQEAKGGERITDLEFAKFYDISLMADGQEVEPDAPVDISISYDKALKAADADHVRIIHFGADKKGNPVPEVLDPDDIDLDLEKGKMSGTAFAAESFSVYGVVYTVDFAWEVDGKEYEFSLPGGGFISLQELVKSLKVVNDDVQNFAAEVESAEFSDPDLLWVGKVEEDTTVGELKKANKLDCQYSEELTEDEIEEINAKEIKAGDWALISLKSFNTEESLTVTMRNGDQFVIKVTDAVSTNPAYTKISRNQMNVNTREDGIKIKLFDYSGTVNNQDIDKVWGNGTDYSSLRQGTGVNRGRTLLFSGSGLSGNEWYNNFTGTNNDYDKFYSGYRAKGIVKDELENGYPVLNDNIPKNGSDDGNLGYLFGAGGQDGVTEYSANGKGLLGLLRKDGNGYYYYSSEDNYARFDGNEYVDLYTDTYYKENGATAVANNGYGSIGFFPFTNYDPNHRKEKGPNELYYNHQLGMSMESYFSYPPDGKLQEGEGDPMIFEFSGDDDVWVYVDGKLAMDLGGVHQPIKGTINFHDKKVYIYEYDEYDSSHPKNETVTEISFADIFGEDGFDDSPYSTHKINFFFLERGGCDSNCALKFNLLTLATADKTFTKEDGEGAGLPGATFTLYTDEDCTEELSVCNEAFTEVSGEDGSVHLSEIPIKRDSNGTPLVYYMKETKAPFGFKKSNTVYKLVYNASTKKYDIFTLENEAAETIVNGPVEPIELSVEKKWQDAAGNEITPGNDHSATFEVKRLKSWEEIIEPDPVPTSTLKIGYYGWVNNGNVYITTDQTYTFVAGSTVSVPYSYHYGYNGQYDNKEYCIDKSGHTGINNASGTIEVTMPPAGQTKTLYFYDGWRATNAHWYNVDRACTVGTATGTMPEDVEQEGQCIPHIDEPDPTFRCDPITLSGNVTTGAFDSGLYSGTDYAGKFPVQETVGGINYSYKYYITEKSKTPANAETIYVDGERNIVTDPSTLKTDDDSTQTIINRELLDIPFEKYWHFDPKDSSEDGPNAYTWTATFQLLSRLVDVETGEAVTSFEPVDGKQLEVSDETQGTGSFDGFPIYCIKDGKEYRIEYSEAEIAYTVRNASNEIVAQWQDPYYYDNPLPTIGEKYSLHYIQDAGENGDSIEDYSLIVNNTPENLKETKKINLSLQKTWPEGVDLTSAHADFVLKRYVYEEYRNFPEDTTDWVDITLDTGNNNPQKMHVPKNWRMTIFGNIKNMTNAENIEFSDGSNPSGVPVYSYDNSSENKEHTFTITFTADHTKTITLEDGAQYVAGGINGFRLTDINDPKDMEVKKDRSFEIPVTLSNDSDWEAAFHNLTAIEEDTQYNVEHPLEITRYVYRYYFEETGCSPEDYVATFEDSQGRLFGDENNRIDNDSEITAHNRLKPGSLKITKEVKVDGANPSVATTSLVDGTYYFTVSGVAGTATADEETRTIPVTVSGGQASTVEVENLTPGSYTITELTPSNGTSPQGNNSLTVTVEPGKTGDAIPAGAMATMVNNINTTQLVVNKIWADTGQEGVDHSNDEIRYILYRIPYTIGDNDVVTEYDPEEVESATGYKKVLNSRTEPAWTNEITNLPVTGTHLLEDGTEIPVMYEYYVSEGTFAGYKSNVSGGTTDGTYSYTINNEPRSTFDKPTEVSVKKQWKKANDQDDSNGHDDDSITFNLVQKKYDAKIYPVRINLINGDGTRSELSETIYMPKGKRLNMRAESQSNGNAHRVNVSGTNKDGSYLPNKTAYIDNANGGREVTFTLQKNGDTWGTEINGTTWRMIRYDSSHNEDITMNDYIIEEDDLSEWINENVIKEENLVDNTHDPYEYTMKLNDDKDGTVIIKYSEHAIGQTEGDTNAKWQGKITDLPYYEKGDGSDFYAYTYELAEIKIDTEPVSATGPGQGETSGYLVTWSQDTNTGAWEITNKKKPGVDIIVKKTDANKTTDNPNRFLDGAKFSLYKVKTEGGQTTDELVTNLVIKESGTENIISLDSQNRFEIPANGVLIQSLLDGNYKLVEREAPAGYVISSADTTFTVLNGEVTEWNLEGDANETMEIPNEPGAELPSSGGPGTTWIYLIGSILLLGCGTILAARRRTRKAE